MTDSKYATPRPRDGRTMYNNCPTFKPGERPGITRTLLKRVAVGESITANELEAIARRPLTNLSSQIRVMLDHGLFRKEGHGRQAVYTRIK